MTHRLPRCAAEHEARPTKSPRRRIFESLGAAQKRAARPLLTSGGVTMRA